MVPSRQKRTPYDLHIHRNVTVNCQLRDTSIIQTTSLRRVTIGYYDVEKLVTVLWTRSGGPHAEPPSSVRRHALASSTYMELFVLKMFPSLRACAFAVIANKAYGRHSNENTILQLQIHVTTEPTFPLKTE